MVVESLAKRTEFLRNMTVVFLSVMSDTESSGSARPGTWWAVTAGKLGILSGSRPLSSALIFMLSAVRTTSELDLGFSRSDHDGTSVSLVPESTFSRLMRVSKVCCVEVEDLAIESEKSLFESDSQASFVFVLDICLMMLSSLVFRSLFFF